MSTLFFSLFACAPSVVELHPIEEGSTVDDVSQWDDARLEVLSPASGAFLPLGEGNWFEARVVDAEGDDLGFEDIGWSSDSDTEWEVVSPAFEDTDLGIGVHTLTATAHLPNGDRLSHALGGVLVQSIYAGTYAGALTVAPEYSGYAFACSGATTLVVDQTGEEVSGDATCHLLLSYGGYDLELDLYYISHITNDDGELGGELAAEVYGYELPVDFEGELTEDGELTGGFITEVLGVILDGQIEATRVSRDTEPLEAM